MIKIMINAGITEGLQDVEDSGGLKSTREHVTLPQRRKYFVLLMLLYRQRLTIHSMIYPLNCMRWGRKIYHHYQVLMKCFLMSHLLWLKILDA